MNIKHSWQHFLSVIIITILITLAMGSSDSGGSSVTPGVGTISYTGRYVGCISREDHRKLTNYVVQKDKKAYERYLLAGLAAGTCTVFEKGESVYVVETAVFSGLVKVRRKGETQEYWTNIEAVQ